MVNLIQALVDHLLSSVLLVHRRVDELTQVLPDVWFLHENTVLLVEYRLEAENVQQQLVLCWLESFLN